MRGRAAAGRRRGRKVWEEGRPAIRSQLAQATGIDVLGSDDQSLRLERKTLVEIGPDAPMWSDFPTRSPTLAWPIRWPTDTSSSAGGKTTPCVKEVDAAGNVIWQYENGKDGVLYKPFSAEPATFAGRRCILISDRGRCRDPPGLRRDVGRRQRDRLAVRRVCRAPASTSSDDPFCATQIASDRRPSNGNVLIADSNDNHRVIEVRADDYDRERSQSGR